MSFEPNPHEEQLLENMTSKNVESKEVICSLPEIILWSNPFAHFLRDPPGLTPSVQAKYHLAKNYTFSSSPEHRVTIEHRAISKSQLISTRRILLARSKSETIDFSSSFLTMNAHNNSKTFCNVITALKFCPGPREIGIFE